MNQPNPQSSKSITWTSPARPPRAGRRPRRGRTPRGSRRTRLRGGVDEQVRQPHVGVHQAEPVRPVAERRQPLAQQVVQPAQDGAFRGPDPHPVLPATPVPARSDRGLVIPAEPREPAGGRQVRACRCSRAVIAPRVRKSSASRSPAGSTPSTQANRTTSRRSPSGCAPAATSDPSAAGSTAGVDTTPSARSACTQASSLRMAAAAVVAGAVHPQHAALARSRGRRPGRWRSRRC